MTSQTKQAIFLVILLLVNDVRAKEEEKKDCFCPKATAAAAVGAVLAAPYVIGGLGFGAGGIAAGSAAAKLMGISATTGYGAGIVAAAQSAGAAGIGLAGNGVIGTVAGTVSDFICGCD